VRKLVRSEEVTHTVTLRREELSVEHLPAEPSTGADDFRLSDAEDGQVIELVLHEERVAIVSVPVERVTVRVHRVSEDVAVSEFLRRERIALDVVPSPPPSMQA
jgi:stress response protein YsnF